MAREGGRGRGAGGREGGRESGRERERARGAGRGRGEGVQHAREEGSVAVKFVARLFNNKRATQIPFEVFDERTLCVCDCFSFLRNTFLC